MALRNHFSTTSDIVISISCFLSLGDAASFRMTCRLMSTSLDNERLWNLLLAREEKAGLLVLPRKDKKQGESKDFFQKNYLAARQPILDEQMLFVKDPHGNKAAEQKRNFSQVLAVPNAVAAHHAGLFSLTGNSFTDKDTINTLISMFQGYARRLLEEHVISAKKLSVILLGVADNLNKREKYIALFKDYELAKLVLSNPKNLAIFDGIEQADKLDAKKFKQIVATNPVPVYVQTPAPGKETTRDSICRIM